MFTAVSAVETYNQQQHQHIPEKITHIHKYVVRTPKHDGTNQRTYTSDDNTNTNQTPHKSWNHDHGGRRADGSIAPTTATYWASHFALPLPCGKEEDR